MVIHTCRDPYVMFEKWKEDELKLGLLSERKKNTLIEQKNMDTN
jgi:hypothetical protein